MEVKEPEVAYGMQRMSIGEYLAFESNSKEKHEYYKGEVFAMAGAKIAHNIIAVNTLTTIKQALKGKPCKPFNSDQRIHIPENTLFTYPDISIVCGEIVTLNKNDEMNIVNPVVLIEVLSRSTREYDRFMKFQFYRNIPSLKEYLLIDFESVNVEAYTITPAGDWEPAIYKNITQSIPIKAIQMQLALSDVYEGIQFA